MVRKRKPRINTAYECSHMAPVIFVDGAWHHITPEGTVGSWCQATTYKVTAAYEGEHYVHEADTRLDEA